MLIRFSFPPLPQQANRRKMQIRLSIANKAQIKKFTLDNLLDQNSLKKWLINTIQPDLTPNNKYSTFSEQTDTIYKQ
jgi:hypothetical protein